MTNAAEQPIPVVETKARANYPFVVQVKNTENWNSHEGAVTLAGATELAQAVQARYPALPVRIEHSTGGIQVTPILPKWKLKAAADERPHCIALWSGAGEPPVIGAKVRIAVNGIGPGVVEGYAVLEGYLGVMVRADDATRPEWHKKQNPVNGAFMTFGAEIAAS